MLLLFFLNFIFIIKGLKTHGFQTFLHLLLFGQDPLTVKNQSAGTYTNGSPDKQVLFKGSLKGGPLRQVTRVHIILPAKHTPCIRKLLRFTAENQRKLLREPADIGVRRKDLVILRIKQPGIALADQDAILWIEILQRPAVGFQPCLRGEGFPAGGNMNGIDLLPRADGDIPNGQR